MGVDSQALPLTRGQLDIWLAQETGHSGTEWQLGLLVRIEGTVERDALEWAIRQAVQEAEPARAAFFEVDGQVFQRAIDYSDIELAFYDLSGSDHAVQEARGIASSIQRTPMAFTGPLFKFVLFRTRLDEFYLFACCHHIVIDGLGMALVSRRVATIYSAIVSGAPIPPAFFGSLQDLIDCELEYEASHDYLDDQAYWSTNLPADSGPHYRLPQAAGERDPYWPSAPAQLDPSVVGRIKELSKALGVRRFSVITAACALLVHDWCAEGSEVVLDFPVSRRVRPESKTLPGMFAGVVPLVLRVSPESAVAGFCEHVDTRIRELLRHQRFPVHALEREGGLRGARQAANRVAVNFVPSRLTLSLAGSPATATYTTHGPVGHFGLNFLGFGDQLFLSTAGAGQPFSNFDVSDLAGRLGRVLVAMTADPGRRLSSFDVLDEDEHARLDGVGNRAVLTQSAPPAVSIPVLFETQVTRTPEAVAISCGGRSWTYREVEEASNRWAHLLAGHGVGPGERVALLVERSAEAIVAMLGVLKTGAAYVPIDPGHPDARIGFVLADAAPMAVLTTAGLVARLAGCDELLVLDIGDPALDSQPGTGLAAPAPEEIAYLIYTSGTTGVPKGVAVAHRNVTRLVESCSSGCRLAAGQVWSQCHSLAFDVSVWEIFGALLHGGRLVVVPDEVAALPGRASRLAGRRAGRCVESDPVGGGDALGRRGWSRRRWWWAGEACPSRAGGSVGAGAGDDQCLRPDRGDGVCGDQCAAGGGLGCGADRCAGGGGGVVCVGQLVACGAGGGGGGVVCGRCRGGRGVLASGFVDGVAVCGLPVRGARGADVSQRGFGVLGCGRAIAVPGPR